MFSKLGVLKYFAIFSNNNICLESLFNKYAGLEVLIQLSVPPLITPSFNLKSSFCEVFRWTVDLTRGIYFLEYISIYLAKILRICKWDNFLLNPSVLLLETVSVALSKNEIWNVFCIFSTLKWWGYSLWWHWVFWCLWLHLGGFDRFWLDIGEFGWACVGFGYNWPRFGLVWVDLLWCIF